MYKVVSLILLLSWQIHVAVVGSNTVVSRQANNALMPYNDTNNQLLGFAAFANGFTIARSDTNALFSDFFPVGGPIDLRSGSLRLQYDLTIDPSASFLSTGSFINAGSSALNLPTLNTSFLFPSATNLLQFITAQTQTTAPVTVDWSYDGAYIANAGAATTTTMEIYSFDGTSLTAAASRAAGGVVNEVRWHPSSYWLASCQTAGTGNRLNSYLFTPPSTFSAAASGIAGGVVYNGISWSPNGNFLMYSSTTNVAVASFNSGTGALATVGAALGVTNTVQTRAMDWIDNSHFVVGLNGGAQLRVYNFNGTSTPTQAATSTPGNTVTAVAPARFNGYIAVGLTGGTSNIRMYQYNGAATLTPITSATINETLAVTSMDWAMTTSSLVVGLATGTGTQLRTYVFDPNVGTLKLTGQVSLLSPSQITETRFAPNGSYIGTVDNNASGTAAFFRAVSVYQLLTQTQPFLLYNMKMVMNSNVLLNTPTIFQGSSVIEGNDNVFTFSAGNTLSVDSNSILLLKNMTINGIYDHSISVDSTGILQLQNVTWVQTSTFTFSQGALQITDDVLFTGTSPFIYTSAQQSTINSNSTWMFDSGMTFSYDPFLGGNNLISMTDQTSILYLLNTNLFVNSIGLNLTQGTLVVDGPCNLTNFASNPTQGVSFGDGASASNNCTVKILPESGFIINSGFLVHNNI